MSNVAVSSQSKSHALIPPWLKGKWGFLGLLFIGYILVNLAWTYFHWGGPERVTLISDLFSFAPGVFATLLAWRVAAQRSLSVPLRRAWFILGLSFLMFLLGQVIWAYIEVILQAEPFPSIADAFYLAFYPLALWGLLSLPSVAHNRRENLTVWLDLLSVLTAATMFVGYFIIVPTAATSNDVLTQLIAPAYPIGSLLVIGGILVVLYRHPSPNTQSALVYLLIGMLFFVGGDLAFGYTSLIGTYSVGHWTDASWNVAQLFFGLAALRKVYRDPSSNLSLGFNAARTKFMACLPPIAVVLGYGLVFYVALVNFGPETNWLLTGALLLTLMAIIRQVASPSFADLPVRTKVFLMLILASGLSVSLVALTSYLTIRSNLVSSVGINLKAHAQDRARAVGNLLAKQFDALESLALSKEIEARATTASAAYTTDYLPTIWDQLEERDRAWKASADSKPLVQDVLNNDASLDLREFQQHFTGYKDLLLTDKQGGVIAATSRPTTFDQSIQSWWCGAFNKGQGAIYMGQPIFDPSAHSRYLTIAVPVYSHRHALVGMLAATYSFRAIEQMIATDGLGPKSQDSLLLPSDQMLISGNQFSFIEPDELTQLHAANADFTLMNFEGQSQLVSFAKVTSFDPEDAAAFDSLNWTLIVNQQATEAFAPLNAAWKATVLSTLIVLLLTAGLAAILAQVLIAPIARLTSLARQIEAGDLSTKAQIESQDEIGTLARALNSMSDALSRTQEELQESGELYRRLVDYSPDMIAVHRHGRYVFVNSAGVRLLGAQSANELIGRSILDVIPAADRETVKQGIEQTQAAEQPTPLLEQTIQRLDGKIIQVELIGIPILYEGQPAIQTVMRDITERKRLEEQWQKFKLGIEHSTDAVFMTDVDGTIRYVNPAFEELYGYFWDEAIGHTPRLLKSGMLSDETYQNFWATLLAKQTVAGQIINRTKDGTLLNIEGSNSPILDESGNLIGFLGVHRDVSERKRAEEKIHQLLSQVAGQRRDLEVRVAQRTEELNTLNQRLQNELIERQALMASLRDSEERFRLLFEASPDAILLIDPNDPQGAWPIVDCNEVACTMNGYTRQELIGQSIDLLNATPGNPLERAEYLEFLRHQGVLHRDGVHRHKNGNIFPIEVSSSVINFAGRELVLGIDRDITERKQTELALQQAKETAEESGRVAEAASRAKSEFLSRMSHELRTPMNAILGFAQLLEMSQKEPLSSTQKERVKQISKGGQHLLDLINEILDISRIEANRLQVSPEPVSVRESVQEVLDLSVPLAVKRNIQIVTKLGQMDENPFVLADRQRLKQVLLNLVGNAVKYNHDGGSVIITCQRSSANKWRISVSDSGPGISQENLARLFIPFERLNDNQPEVEGTGLGLVLAKRLVELMHGQMGVESTEGKGSTFWLELPCTESPLVRANLASTTGHLPALFAAARRILYIEDNVANFELIQQVLADYAQIELLWAANAKAGLEVALQHHPNLILLDLHLGGRDGGELLKELKRDPKTTEIPVVVVSADATSSQAQRLTSLGAEAYLTKPLDVKHFVQLMEELLREKVM